MQYFTVILLLLFSFSCVDQGEKNDTLEVKNKIDSYLAKTMELHNIPGLALAVIEDDEIVYEKYFGEASLEDSTSVSESTLFRIFSATKLITATGVFQLIENGALSLDDTISKYLDDLPVQWQNIKVENLLSHSSGLPDIVRYKSTLSDVELMDELSKAKMEFVVGNEFRYNQTNYWLLARIIEKITGVTFDEYILNNQFNNSTSGVLFSSNSQEVIPSRAVRYFYNGKTEKFEKDTNNNGVRGHSGNGLNITLRKFIEWNRQLDNDKLLNEKTKSAMWSPFHFTNQKDDFLHGWGKYYVNGLGSYGFSGGNLAAFRKFPEKNVTIVLLSNGYQIPAFDIIVNDVARIVIPGLRSKGLALEEDVMSFIFSAQYNEAKQSFKKLKEENPGSDFDNLKWNVNSIGNAYAFQDEPQKALEVFKFNVEANPNWWVSLASLAEIYDSQKDTLNSIENYQNAIMLNEENEWNYNEQMENRVAELKNN